MPNLYLWTAGQKNENGYSNPCQPADLPAEQIEARAGFLLRFGLFAKSVCKGDMIEVPSHFLAVFEWKWFACLINGSTFSNDCQCALFDLFRCQGFVLGDYPRSN